MKGRINLGHYLDISAAITTFASCFTLFIINTYTHEKEDSICCYAPLSCYCRASGPDPFCRCCRISAAGQSYGTDPFAVLTIARLVSDGITRKALAPGAQQRRTGYSLPQQLYSDCGTLGDTQQLPDEPHDTHRYLWTRPLLPGW